MKKDSIANLIMWIALLINLIGLVIHNYNLWYAALGAWCVAVIWFLFEWWCENGK